jgi:hypothetical protein
MDIFKSICGLDCCLMENNSPKCTPPVCMLYLWCPNILLAQPHCEQVTSPIDIMDFRLTPCSVAVGRNNAFSGCDSFVCMLPRVWDGCLRNQGWILTKGGRILHVYRAWIGSGTLSASCSVGNAGCFPDCKAARAWSWPLLPSAATVKNVGTYTSAPFYALIAWCLIRHRDNPNFYRLVAWRTS